LKGNRGGFSDVPTAEHGLLTVAGIAAFIEAHSQRPIAASGPQVRCLSNPDCHSANGLSQTAYDLLRSGGWALVIFGVLLVVMGLIRYWGTQRRAASGD
jgi:hypothetical protein